MPVSSAHLTGETLARFTRRELPPGELLVTARHLGECAECRARAGTADAHALHAALRPDPADTAHLDPETELIPYAGGTAGPATREIVETHVEDCASCRAELRELEALRTAPRPRRIPVLAIAAAAAAIAIALLLVLYANRSAPPVPRVHHPTVSVQQPPAPPAYARPEWEALVREARRTGKLPFRTDLARLRGKSDSLRGADDAPVDGLAPAGIVVDETRPRFTWPERRGAVYVVLLYENDEEIARSKPLSAAEWRPERELQRGRTYAWQVEVRRGDALELLPPPAAPEARFRIAGADAHRQIEEARRAHPDDHLLHAILYARAGLEAEARAAWERANHAATP